ncbi:MAG: copper homeostasis protein CutC [Defluviitaleaceae bacterium]|nr:copper homeostasis protein CutC [Defluviitaleaceae bacterium]
MAVDEDKKVTIEVCCGSYEDVVAAKQAGAHRVELNSALFLGGLTPSLGSLRLCKKNVTDIKVIPMVRPRQAGFAYSNYEYDEMKEDAKIFLENDADGIVFGFLHKDGTVDEDRTREFVDIAGNRDTVFHRAFDVTPDPFAALESLIKCGVTRILTSGQAPSVFEGMELIKELVRRAAGRIEILPGAGITPANVSRIVSYTGVTQIHFAALENRVEPSVANNRSIYFGGALYPREDIIEITSAQKISEVVNSI